VTQLATIALDPALLRMAGALATELADALASPPPLEPDGDRSPTSPRWRGQSLSKGAAGIAVLHGIRAHTGHGPWNRAHAWLACANREELSAGPGAGLWFGAGSLAFALSVAAPPGQYRTAQSALDAAVATMTRSRLEAAAARMTAGVRPALAEFDLVRGLTGLGAYWLRRDPGGPLIRDVLTYVVRLCQPLPASDPAGRNVPGWWTNDVPSGQDPETFARGWSDQGMAHGIAGPLSLLAMTKRTGITVPGQIEAMERICQWLDIWRQDSPAGSWWPERLTLAELHAGHSQQGGPARPSWCYGTPGITRSTMLTALALGDTARQDAAEDALARCLADPAQLRRLTNPAICHGLAGVLATCWYAAADARTPALAAHLPNLLQALLREHTTSAQSPAWQQPGLVEGTAGVALTLHSIATASSGGWPTCLLID